MPTFSIIVPAYNRAKLLPRALKSTLAQTDPDFEVIVVDDASTDNIAEVMAGFTDSRIRYVRLDKNGGASRARNDGFKVAQGELISLLDSDDEMHPDFLAKTRAAWTKAGPNVGFSWTGKRTIRYEKENEVRRWRINEAIWEPSYPTSHGLLVHCLGHDPVWGTSHGVTLRKGVLESIGGFDESLPAREDVDLLFRLLQRYDYLVIPEILMTLHHDADPASRVDGNVKNRGIAYTLMYPKYRELIDKTRFGPYFWNSIIIDSLVEAGCRGKALGWIVERIKDKPASPWLYWRLLRTAMGSS